MSVVKRAWAKWLVVPAMAGMLSAGCNDDGDDDDVLGGPDAGDGGAVRIDGGMDAGGPGSDAGWSDLKVIPTAISATGHDRFFGVAYDATGNIFAVGQTSEGVTPADDSSVVLAKFTPDGVLDTTFGGGKGYVVQNVTAGAQNVEAARSIVIQKNGPNAGKIVIAGDAEHGALPADAGTLSRDTDIVLVRFLPSGQVDTSFGTDGTLRLDLGTGVEVSTTLADGGVQQQLAGADTAWSLGQSADGTKLVIHGATRATGVGSDGGVRTDNDYTLVRLTENGALDTTFATTGIVRTDVGQVNGSARSATILADNSIVAAGYTTSTVLGQNTQQPVIYKVKADGTPDTTFATTDQITTPGLWHGFARSDSQRAEAYGATPQGDKFVTVGYGPTPVSTNGSGTDWVFFRFNADGSQDKTFGTNGETFLDAAKFSDNGRSITTLPDNRILAVGGGRPVQPPSATAGQQPSNVDGMIGVLTPTGQPDTTFAPGGFRLIDWGNADFLHACAVAPAGTKKVAIVGAASGGRETTSDDDTVLLLWTAP